MSDFTVFIDVTNKNDGVQKIDDISIVKICENSMRCNGIKKGAVFISDGIIRNEDGSIDIRKIVRIEITGSKKDFIYTLIGDIRLAINPTLVVMRSNDYDIKAY